MTTQQQVMDRFTALHKHRELECSWCASSFTGEELESTDQHCGQCGEAICDTCADLVAEVDTTGTNCPWCYTLAHGLR